MNDGFLLPPRNTREAYQHGVLLFRIVIILVGLLTALAGAKATATVTISTYDAFVADNPGKTPGTLMFMRSSSNDYNYAMGTAWVTIDHNGTYVVDTLPAGYYWTGLNNNSYSQASGCTVSGLNSISGSGIYLADGASISMSINCVETDNTPPTASSASVNSAGTTLTIVFSEDLDNEGVGTSDFSVTAGGSSVAVSSLSIAGNAVTLTLGSVIKQGTAVTVSYTDNGGIYDLSWNELDSFTGLSVTNNSTQSALLSQTITFADPGTQDYGTTPTLAATASSGLTVSFTSSTTSVCTVTGTGALSFLKTGTCTVSADQAGNAAYLAATTVTRSFTVEAVVPGMPTIGTAMAGDGEASVSFTAPSSDGGASITGYTVTSVPGGITATGTSSPITVIGLTNGTDYTFTVAATNSAGTGSASAASNEVTPQGIQTITFDDLGTVTYGVSDFAPNALSSSGLALSLASDNPTVAEVTADNYIHVVGAGSVNITASQAGNAAYAAALAVSKTLIVQKAPLTIAVVDDTIAEGDADPVFQYTFSGFVNGDDSTVLVGLTASREEGSSAGNYDVTPVASADNYELTFVDGILTIREIPSLATVPEKKPFLHFFAGNLSVGGFRGELRIFDLRGRQVATLSVTNDGLYPLKLKAGVYLLRLGSQNLTVISQEK